MNVPGRRQLSLAHLSLIAFSPQQLIPIAADAGFDLVDLRLSPATLADRVYADDELTALCRELRPILRDVGLAVWDVEIIRLNDRTEPEDYLRLMETAAALGARRMKLVCDSEDHGRAVEVLGRLCDLAAPFGLVMDLEYMIFSCVKSLEIALGLVGAAARPICGCWWMRCTGCVRKTWPRLRRRIRGALVMCSCAMVPWVALRTGKG